MQEYLIITPVISLRAQRLTGSTAPTGLHMRLSRRSQKKMEGYSIQVKARDQEPQTIEGTDISYRYISSGEVLKLLKAAEAL